MRRTKPAVVPKCKTSGVARGGAGGGGANAPPQIFVVPLLPKTGLHNAYYPRIKYS